jgi:predicted methyltransferase
MRRAAAGFALLVLGLGLVAAQEKSVKPGINDPFKDPDVPTFLGKFEVESREIYAHREEIVKRVGLKPGMAVADVGAGTGLFTRLFAPEVGDRGKVYAVDIAPKFLDHIKKTSREAGIKNVETVRCAADDVNLKENSVDMVFICDTYHHFEFPHKTMTSIHGALKPGGQVILIDFVREPGKSTEWVLNHVRAGKDVFAKEVTDAGFKQVGEEKFLKENYFLRFEKVEQKK